ncbi:protein kinase domain-containing protein [Cryptosporidium muris RN66]|uniref:Protein kinase domain-containing protein n=1 Tax=Cryptosporidium muris (strain RN66) TaxID=441375 RepID=B6AIQ9_CRYMR|nr:protein kinase domain-containing protein [Cryptosporidium muris RN66]EEA08100.1 protein kinase domain-containing protein [Cryptosporidium muris RN66]|eukprot:XP_002142449.1 protein kinase domain-containing protein [Cryptosporidium muris RN66]
MNIDNESIEDISWLYDKQEQKYIASSNLLIRDIEIPSIPSTSRDIISANIQSFKSNCLPTKIICGKSIPITYRKGLDHVKIANNSSKAYSRYVRSIFDKKKSTILNNTDRNNRLLSRNDINLSIQDSSSSGSDCNISVQLSNSNSQITSSIQITPLEIQTTSSSITSSRYETPRLMTYSSLSNLSYFISIFKENPSTYKIISKFKRCKEISSTSFIYRIHKLLGYGYHGVVFLAQQKPIYNNNLFEHNNDVQNDYNTFNSIDKDYFISNSVKSDDEYKMNNEADSFVKSCNKQKSIWIRGYNWILPLIQYNKSTLSIENNNENTSSNEKNLVAIKIINLEPLILQDNRNIHTSLIGMDILEQLHEEIRVLISCENNQSVVRYIESFHINPNYIGVVTEYIPGYTLRDIYKSYGAFPESIISYVCYKILNVLSYMTSFNFRYKKVHKDIKAANIMIDCHTGNLKLIDFGVCQILDTVLGTHPNIRAGTLQWMAPEMISSCKCLNGISGFESLEYDPSIDIWSLGVTALELAIGFPPNIYKFIANLCNNNLEENLTRNHSERCHLTKGSLNYIEHSDNLNDNLEAHLNNVNDIHLCLKYNNEYINNDFSFIRSYFKEFETIHNNSYKFSDSFIDFLNCTICIDKKKRWSCDELLKHPFIVNKKKYQNIYKNFQIIEKELYRYNLNRSKSVNLTLEKNNSSDKSNSGVSYKYELDNESSTYLDQTTQKFTVDSNIETIDDLPNSFIYNNEELKFELSDISDLENYKDINSE